MRGLNWAKIDQQEKDGKIKQELIDQYGEDKGRKLYEERTFSISMIARLNMAEKENPLNPKQTWQEFYAHLTKRLEAVEDVKEEVRRYYGEAGLTPIAFLPTLPNSIPSLRTRIAQQLRKIRQMARGGK
jgi:hypothetical protein